METTASPVAGRTSLGWSGATWRASSSSPDAPMKSTSAGRGSTPSLPPHAGTPGRRCSGGHTTQSWRQRCAVTHMGGGTGLPLSFTVTQAQVLGY